MVSVSEVMEKNRLGWFGHVERKDVEDWVSRCRKLEVVGNRGRGGLGNHGNIVSMEIEERTECCVWIRGIGLGGGSVVE